MEKLLNIRVSQQFADALEETKWTLRKSMAEIIREAVVEYMENKLPKEALKKVKKILDKAEDGDK